MPFLLLIILRKIICYISLTHFIRTDTLMLSVHRHVSHMKISSHLEGKEIISIAREVYMHDLKVRA